MKECDFELLKVYDPNYPKIRLGVNDDGGYVIVDIPVTYDCYLSCGVGEEESFSRDLINKYGLDKNNCFAFDGTIHNYPYKYIDKINFIRKNIGSFNDDKNTNLNDFISSRDNIFLKMDIEGGEYPWLQSLPESSLQKFCQIVIEFHNINNNWVTKYDQKMDCLKKLTSTHYLMHAHGNNWSNMINGIPNVIELTFLNKKFFKELPKLNKISLPIINLDYPNNSGYSDINLNHYPFVSQ